MGGKMDIREIKNLRVVLEKDIMELLVGFERATECYVKAIDLDKGIVFGKRNGDIFSVTAVVEI
jgi:hypothetical protein